MENRKKTKRKSYNTQENKTHTHVIEKNSYNENQSFDVLWDGT